MINTVKDQMNAEARCGFCFDTEQGKHGEIKREYSPEWEDFILVCRLHSKASGMIDGVCPTCRGRKLIIPMGYQGEATDCPTCIPQLTPAQAALKKRHGTARPD